MLVGMKTGKKAGESIFVQESERSRERRRLPRRADFRWRSTRLRSSHQREFRRFEFRL